MKELKNGNVISEKHFIPLLDEVASDFLELSFLIEQQPINEWAKRYYALLSEKAHDLESFLDEYHARNNQDFIFITELFASLKWFGLSGFIQKHILIRFGNYGLDLPENVINEFLTESRKSLVYINESILSILSHVHKEATRIGLTHPKSSGIKMTGFDSFERMYLPHTVGDEKTSDPNSIIAELATRYKSTCNSLKKIHIRKDLEIDSIRNQTIYQFDETKSRHLESKIHNIQSRYDTYVKNSVIESRHRSLPCLRGFSSISFHLLEIATILVHFYERHLSEVRSEESTRKISGIIQKDALLKILNDYYRFYAIKFFLDGEHHADSIVEEFIRIKNIDIVPPVEFSLHARPLSLIARIAMHYNAPLEIEVDGNKCNAGSIMQMILLAGNNPKPKKITFIGEERALSDLKDLFDIGCLERGNVEDLPPHLNYLIADDPIKR